MSEYYFSIVNVGYLNHIYSHYPLTFLNGRRGRKGEEEGRTGNVSPLSLSLSLSLPLYSLFFALIPTFLTNCTNNYILSKQENFSCISL